MTHEKGLSLIDVLIALAILTFSAVGIGTALIDSEKLMHEAKIAAEVTELKIALYEHLNLQKFSYNIPVLKEWTEKAKVLPQGRANYVIKDNLMIITINWYSPLLHEKSEQIEWVLPS